MTMQSGLKMFLSVITASIVLAHLIDFLIRQCYVNPLQIWSAMLIQDMKTSAPIYCRWRVISANTIGVVNVHILNRQSGFNGKLVSSYWLKFAMLRLFVETMHIYKAVATGNGKNEFYREHHVQTANNPRSPQSFTNAQRLLASQPTLFFVTIYL